MPLSLDLEQLQAFPQPEDFDRFRRDMDPAWIDAALAATGTATVRKRRLPAEQVIWLVIGMALMRNRPIEEVASSLDLVLPSANGRSSAAPSTFSQARGRLGEEPMRWLFARTARVWAEASADRDRWRGLALYGLDGTTLRVPDSDENRACFGLASGGHRGMSGYPLMRVVGLMALRSHVLAAAAFGPYRGGSEFACAAELWSKIPNHSLVILDRYYVSAQVIAGLQRAGIERHWLLPARSNTKWNRIKRLGRNDELVELTVSRTARRKDPSLPSHIQARAIRYQRKGCRPRTLLTSLVDPKRYPACELIERYHERWEIELGYGEIKTRMMEQTHRPLRSKSPERVYQEVWGLLIAYNLVRREMERIADEAAVKPTRISFALVHRMICNEFLWCSISSPGAIPRHLRELRDDILRFVLPKRRVGRAYRREVKVKMSNYLKKRRNSAIKPPK